jgi:hypothetical protein
MSTQGDLARAALIAMIDGAGIVIGRIEVFWLHCL